MDRPYDRYLLQMEEGDASQDYPDWLLENDTMELRDYARRLMQENEALKESCADYAAKWQRLLQVVHTVDGQVRCEEGPDGGPCPFCP